MILDNNNIMNYCRTRLFVRWYILNAANLDPPRLSRIVRILLLLDVVEDGSYHDLQGTWVLTDMRWLHIEMEVLV